MNNQARTRKAKRFFLVAPALLLAILAVAALTMRSELPLPPTPVPQLVLAGTPTMPLRAELVPIGKEALVPLPMRIAGRAVPGPVPHSIRHQWPAFYAEARFRGNGVTLRFDDDVNRFRIRLDQGQGGIVELSRPGAADLRILGLAPGRHDIRLDKISESPTPASFGGFWVDQDSAPLTAPPDPSTLIEFIGDSDTVGYASTAQRRDCTDQQVFAATDTSQTFARRVADHFGADTRIIARSGIGVVRNAGGNPGQTMPELYPRALPDERQSASERPADIIVIALGSNDFGSDTQPTEPWPDFAALRQDFQPALIQFLQERHRQNPAALLVLLAFGEYGEQLLQSYRAADETLRNSGAHTVLVTLFRLERRACQWHPSPADHALIADKLITAITDEWGALQSHSAAQE